MKNYEEIETEGKKPPNFRYVPALSYLICDK